MAEGSSGPALPWLGSSAPKSTASAASQTPATQPSDTSTIAAVSPVRKSVEPPVQESRVATAAPQDMVRQNPTPAVSAREEMPQQALAPQQTPTPQITAPEKPVQQPLPRQSSLSSPTPDTPEQRPAAVAPRAAIAPPAKERRVSRPAAEAPVEVTAPKKTARRDRPARRPSNEALSTVRKFGDNLQGIPVSSYAADGTQRRIVIRPTSIQDVYYYSSRPQ
jgi:hypothetical protein